MRVFQQVLAAILICCICVALQMVCQQAHCPAIVSSYLHVLDDVSLKDGHKREITPASTTIPPTCQFHNIRNRTINRIYFLHMRKAGGTSLRSYFSQVAKKHGLQFEFAEGLRQPEQPGDENTLYITHIRQPIARAISHYKYARRWLCKTQLKVLNNSRNHGVSFVPTLNNTYMSLDNFTRSHHYIPHDLWTCASNCYARWASGHPEHVNYNDDVSLQQLEQAAHASLWNYNVIIVFEWLYQYPDYVKSIESIFGVKHRNRTRSMYCGKEAAAANRLVPLVVQAHELELLHQVNQVDLKLYQDLTACQPQLLLQQYDDNVVNGTVTGSIRRNGTRSAR
jgi:Sulfotransferase family